jgi:hypothetical protein
MVAEATNPPAVAPPREMENTMAEIQGATPPPWLGRSRWRLLGDVIGGWRQNLDKLRQLAALLVAFVRPALVRRRLERLRALGHVDAVPTLAQMLVAARDQMIVSAVAETRIFYRSQGIPWIFHNLRRFLSGPATVLDPMGLFSSREALVHHVLQTFHRHPVYDLVLLRAYPAGVEEMARQAAEIMAGTHRHQRALTSLIEDGSYHQRLGREIAAFQADPHVPARPIPEGLVGDRHLMAAMDQFKDIRGFAAYAARLPAVGTTAALAWLNVALGRAPRRIRVEACDPEIAARHGLV